MPGHNYVNDHMFSPVQLKNQIYENENYNNQYNYAKKSLADALSKKLPIGQILNLDKFEDFWHYQMFLVDAWKPVN